ncbi:hypothetical protein DV737_g3708, partial [Chaetothyriales sp. CBS 132003]
MAFSASAETETPPTSTTTIPPKPSPTITQRTQPSELLACATTLNAAFVDDPMLRYTLTRNISQPSKSTSLITDPSVTSLLFTIITTAGMTAHGTISSVTHAAVPSETDEASPSLSLSSMYPTVGIFMPPGRDPSHPLNFLYQLPRIARLLFRLGPAVSWRLVVSLPLRFTAMKARAFTPQQLKQLDFYYVFFLGTRPEAQGQGLGSAWLRACQAEAARAGKPIWLESSTEKSRDLYLRLGWRVVDEEVFGKGLFDAKGGSVEGGNGEGTKMWGMVWWPEGMDPREATNRGAGKNDDPQEE